MRMMYRLQVIITFCVVVALISVDSVAADFGGVEQSSKPSSSLHIPTIPDELIVTPVIDRPLDVDEGEQVLVKGFLLDGFKDLPDNDIKVSDAEQIVEAIREERNGVFTVGQLQLLVDEITKYYRSRGLILAHAILPAQEIKEGKVRLAILEGRLSRVVVEGNLKYDTNILISPMKDMVGKVVTTREVEGGLFTLSDFPGLNVYGLFRPGETVGTTELVLKVQDERPYVASVGMDNHGPRLIGPYRVFADLTLNNPSGYGDSLHLKLQKGYDPQDSGFGLISYQLPIIDPDYTAGLSFSRNEYKLGYKLEDLNYRAVSEDAGLYVRRNFIRSRLTNLYLTASYTHRNYRLWLHHDLDSEDELSILKAELGFDDVDSLLAPYLGGALNSLSIAYSHGLRSTLGSMGDDEELASRVGEDGERPSGRFDKYEISLIRLQQLDKLFKGHSLLLRASGMYSPTMLTPMEMFTIGGPNSVRAYPSSEYLGDKGVFASVEYLVNAPGFADKPAFRGRTWGEILQMSIFFDYGAVWRHAPGVDDVRYMDLRGMGVGIHINLPEEFEAHLTVSTPITPEDATNEHHPQVFANARYFF